MDEKNIGTATLGPEQTGFHRAVDTLKSENAGSRGRDGQVWLREYAETGNSVN